MPARRRGGAEKAIRTDTSSSSYSAAAAQEAAARGNKTSAATVLLLTLFAVAASAILLSRVGAPGAATPAHEERKSATSPLEPGDFLRVAAAIGIAEQQLHRSAADGKLRDVRKAIADGADVCSLSGHDRQTVVLSALARRHASLAMQSSVLPGDYEAIISEVVRRESYGQCSAYQCPLYYAVHYRNMPALRAILETSPLGALKLCLVERDSYNRTVFHAAAADRSAGFARLFMREIRQSILSTRTLRDTSVMQLLNLSFSPIINSHANSAAGLTRLDRPALALAVGHVDMLMLINAAKRVDLLPAVLTAGDGLGQSVLHIAAAAGRTEAVKLLLSHMHKEDAVALNVFGQTAHDVAAVGGFASLAALLPSRRCDGGNCNAGVSGYQDRRRQSQVGGGDSTDDSGSDADSNSQSGIGGWNTDASTTNTPSDSATANSTCGFDVVSAEEFTSELFLDHCIGQRKPLLVRRLVSSWPANQNWRRGAFLARYGDARVSVNTIPYGDQYGHRVSQSTMTLSMFVSKHMPLESRASRNKSGKRDARRASGAVPAYVFDGSIFHRNGKLWDDVRLPDALAGYPTILRQLIVGPVGSGSPPHFHGLAVNFLAFGRKRWMLTQPDNAYFSSQTAMEWFSKQSHNAGNGAYTECVQSSGDALIVPDSWGHAVINLQNSIALAVELAVAR